MKIKLSILAILVAAGLLSSQPIKCEGAGLGSAFTAAAVVLQPTVCQASVMEQLCSSVTNFLDDEADKAGAALKGCKANCGWKKRKNDLITAAKKRAKNSCAKGEVPDVNELSKGLDRNTKDKLKDLYDRNSRMFDGTAKLKAVDFNAVSSKNAAITGKTASLGKGGQVADLKTSEPATPKLNTASEFSLSGTKLSGETPSQAATKQSPILLASASSAKTPVDAPIASAKTALSPQKAQGPATALPKCTESATLCMSVVPGKPCSCPTVNLCDAGPGVAGMCMSAKYCAGEGCPGQQECSAGKITIVQSKDLILYKPFKFWIWSFAKSPEVSFKITYTGKAPSKIKWSLSNKKAKITTWFPNNKQTINVVPVSESGAEGDVTITATVDDCPPASLPLTVRRPKFMTHPDLVVNPEREIANLYIVIRTKGNFQWTLTDKWKKPLVDVPVSENVTVNKVASINSTKFVWKDQNYKNKLTNANGQLDDRYLISASVSYVDRGEITAVLNQELTAAGWVGTSTVTIKTLPQELATPEKWATISYTPEKLILK